MVAVNLSDDLVNTAKKHAKVNLRSTPKQIEHWANIGRALEESPSKNYSDLINEAMEQG